MLAGALGAGGIFRVGTVLKVAGAALPGTEPVPAALAPTAKPGGILALAALGTGTVILGAMLVHKGKAAIKTGPGKQELSMCQAAEQVAGHELRRQAPAFTTLHKSLNQCLRTDSSRVLLSKL